MKSKLLLMIILCLPAILSMTGCAGVPLSERAELGTYPMRSDRDPLNNSLSEHVYFTREASVGGRGVGGGGCGCN